MTLPLIKPAGWNPNDPVTAAQLNAFQNALIKAIDGVNGGVYTLASTLSFGGSLVRILDGLEIDGSTLVIDADATLQADGDVTVNGTLTLSGTSHVQANAGADIHINNNASLQIEDGGFLFVDNLGDVRWNAGSHCSFNATSVIDCASSQFNLTSGANLDVENNARVNVLSGGKILGVAGGEIQVWDAEDLTINASTFVWRSTMTPTYADPAWGPISAGTPTWCMLTTAVAAKPLIIPLPLKPGDTLTTARVTLRGGAGSGHGANAPATPPRAKLISVSPAGLATLIRQVDDMSGAGNGAAYDASHSITLSGAQVSPAGTGLPLVVGTDPIYMVVLSEGGADAANNTTVVTMVDGTGAARSFRGTGGNEIL